VARAEEMRTALTTLDDDLMTIYLSLHLISFFKVAPYAIYVGLYNPDKST